MNIGAYAIPAVVVLCGVIMFFSKKDLMSEFIYGCRKGAEVTYEIMPTLILLVCAVSMFSSSGALDMICFSLSHITDKIGLDKNLLPVIIMRPVSGSAATAMINNLFENIGPDSFAGRAASIIMGSSDTIIYTLAMYFSSVGIKKTRYALHASLINMIFCVAVSCILTKICF